MAAKPAANKKKKTLMMDDDDDDDNDFIRKPSVTSNKPGQPKALPKIPGAKKSVAPPRAPSEAVDP